MFTNKNEAMKNTETTAAINTIGAGDCFYAALLATGDPNFANKKASEYVSNNIERD